MDSASFPRPLISHVITGSRYFLPLHILRYCSFFAEFKLNLIIILLFTACIAPTLILIRFRVQDLVAYGRTGSGVQFIVLLGFLQTCLMMTVI